MRPRIECKRRLSGSISLLGRPIVPFLRIQKFPEDETHYVGAIGALRTRPREQREPMTEIIFDKKVVLVYAGIDSSNHLISEINLPA